ncbi:MAG: NAD-dependent epimerase/dehydratase family protein [Halobacteria archaeon]
MSKALITGGCGFIGATLTDWLMDTEYEVRVTDLCEADCSSICDLDVGFRNGDLTRPDTLDNVVEDVDVVFHTAAIFDYSTLIDQEVYRKVNVEGTENLLEACVEADVDRFVNWSTAGVYKPVKGKPRLMDENHEKGPESSYDRSKWQQEQVAMEYDGENGMDVLTVRPAAVYGPGNMFGIAQIIQAVANGHLRMYPAVGEYKMPLVHVDDMVGASIHLAENGEHGEAYNVVDDQGYDMARVLKYIGSLTGTRMFPAPLPNRMYQNLSGFKPLLSAAERAFDMMGQDAPIGADALSYLRGNYWLSNRKLKDTGYEMLYPDFRAGMQETVNWYRSQGILEGEVTDQSIAVE